MIGVKQLKKKSGSIYSDVEELVLEPWQRMRQRFLSPIAFVLARLGISADMLSFASVGVVRPSRMLLYAAIALYFFFHIDLLNYLLLVYLLTLPLVFLSFWRLRKAL